MSTKQNEFLITAICFASKHPAAIPVPGIMSVTVVNALMTVFSRMGFPKSDLGMSFMTVLTTEFFEKFGIRVTHSSVYHPQSNSIEGFHSPVKRALKVLCLETGEAWEYDLPAALFALRMVTHESTGFNRAELVYG